LLIKQGIELLLVARSTERLPALAADLETRGAVKVVTFAADLADVSTHAGVLAYAQEQLPEFDTVLLAYGTMLDQEACKHSVQLALRELDTNFISASALLMLFAEYFEVRKTGIWIGERCAEPFPAGFAQPVAQGRREGDHD